MFSRQNGKYIFKHLQTAEKFTYCTQHAKETEARAEFIRNVVNRLTFGSLLTKSAESKKIVIDFSSPNIAKPFHIGILRSTIIGNFIANINQFYTNQVVRLNYLGDLGTQFGMLQCGLKIKNINLTKSNNLMKIFYEAYIHANTLAKTDKSLYNKASQYSVDIENCKETLEDWKKIRERTVIELAEVYQRMGIKFDDYHWESDYNASLIKDLILSLEHKGIIKCDERGRKIAKVGNRKVPLLKSDGSTLSTSRDVASIIDRYNRYNFDKMLYIVDSTRTEHFKLLFDIMKQINPNYVKGCEFIKFGRLHGLNTKSGHIVFLKDILDEAKQRMYDSQNSLKIPHNDAVNEETWDVLGTSAVIINELKHRRHADYIFDWDKVLQADGDSAIKLQYLHYRLLSLEKNSNVTLPDDCDPTYLKEDIILDVVAEIAKFEDLLQRSYLNNEACILLEYMFNLTRILNRMFDELYKEEQSADVEAQRLLIVKCTRIVVKTGLEILGLKPLCQL